MNFRRVTAKNNCNINIICQFYFGEICFDPAKVFYLAPMICSDSPISLRIFIPFLWWGPGK